MSSASETFRLAAHLEPEVDEDEPSRARRARRREASNSTLGQRDRVLYGLEPELYRPSLELAGPHEVDLEAQVRAANNQAAKQIRRLAARDGLRCHYCKVGLTYETATRDHKIPRSKDGPTTLDNLVLACGACNTAKGDMDYADFVAIKAGKRVTVNKAPQRVKGPAPTTSVEPRFKLEKGSPHPNPGCPVCAKRKGALCVKCALKAMGGDGRKHPRHLTTVPPD